MLRHARVLVGLALGVALVAAACGDDDSGSSSAATTAAGASTTKESAATTAAGGATTTAGATTTSGEKVDLRLGVFPNITHATGLVGIGKGIFEEKLGANVTLEPESFSTGTKAIEALFAEAIDATYIGPNPAINAYAQSKGDAVRVVSGATSGGAYLVVKPDIASPADLKGKTLATPSLGNTQDVALRAWLKEQRLSADTTGGGDVSIKPQENAQTLEAFVAGTIDGAWVPEPWATRMVQEGGAKVLVDERDLWPNGEYVTTQLLVARKYLEEHPDVVKRLLEGQVAANEFVNANPEESQKIANDEIEKFTSKRIKDAVMAAAWKNLTFTNDPIASSLLKSAQDAQDVGLLKPVDNLAGLYDLTLLNEVLKAAGQQPVQGPSV